MPRSRLCLLPFALGLALVASGTAAAQSSGDAPDASNGVKVQDKADKIGIAILDVATEGAVTADEATSVGALVAEEVDEIGAFDVITQDDVRRMISFDQMKAALDCESDENCLAEIGGALGVPYLLTGTISKIGGQVVLALALIDVDNVGTISRETASAKNVVALAKDLRVTVRRLLAAVLYQNRGTLRLNVNIAGAKVFLDDKSAGQAPLDPIELPAGPVKITVRSDGYVAWERVLEIPPKRELVVDVKLIPTEETYQRQMWTAVGLQSGALGVSGVALLLGAGVGVGGVVLAEAFKNAGGLPFTAADGTTRYVVRQQEWQFIVAARTVAAVALVAGGTVATAGVIGAFFVDYPDPISAAELGAE